MPIIPGFQNDLFVSYAHRDDWPWREGATGWVTEFVKTLAHELEEKDRRFKLWFDPQLRTGDDFDSAIGKAISESAVFLSVLSPAYDDCPYCKKEVSAFRELCHPAFGLKVGTLRRMQALVLEDLPEDRWPPEVRGTSPYRFHAPGIARFNKPEYENEKHPYVQGLWETRDSIWAILEEMRRQKESGTVIEMSYEVQRTRVNGRAAVYLAEVSDALYHKRESLGNALQQLNEFELVKVSEVSLPSGAATLSVHLFDQFSGRPMAGKDVSLPRLQLKAALAGNPIRRPIVWLARDLKPEDADTESHKQFLQSLLDQSAIELLRTGFEDLKDEIQKRMRPKSSPALKTVRRAREGPIVHLWHHDTPDTLVPLKQRLRRNNCAISVFPCLSAPYENLQSKLAFCDGLIVSYTAQNRSWAEEVMMATFQLRRREERPIAFAAAELPPVSGVEFNFDHPRVIPLQGTPDGDFPGIDRFVARLAEDDV